MRNQCCSEVKVCICINKYCHKIIKAHVAQCRCSYRINIIYILISFLSRCSALIKNVELRMLRFSIGVTRKERIRDEDSCESRVMWFGHVQKRDAEIRANRQEGKA